LENEALIGNAHRSSQTSTWPLSPPS